ncbi:tetratricopeptide repeat protein [Leptobacterium flavescens]|uniref:Tetratricopeptide repeat protein n=1 Tax=Leptobacterium flavescens TaxID=472055 RepID=A0A6P0UMC7_9FLAO|nr:tetratricopeptide repeat protein [Leptobacterium flavescens]NER14167.1 tetratricopeptide repeat protein [Leptobacterium flavescens]
MQFSSNEEENFPISRFESMLKTNNVYFFDSTDFEEIIHHYLDSGKVALAKKAIKIGLEQHTSSINLKLLHIEVLVFENKLEVAEKMLNELMAIEYSNEEIYIQKANIYSKKDDHEKAIELLKVALAYAEETTDIFSLIGMEYLFMDDYKAAKDYFIKCIDEDFEDYSSLYNIIYCYEFLEDFDGAIEFLNGYLDRNPYSEVAWHQLGKQFFAKEMYKEALASFEFAIYSDDIFIGAYLEKAKVLEKLGRYEEAIENYETTLQIDDPTSFAYLRIGICQEKLGNKDIAKQYYYKTVHEDPLLDKGWIAITDFYFKQKNYKKALYYINKALNIDSENVLYWKRSAEINEKLSLYEESDISYQKTIELGNYELETWISWSDILLKLGDYESGIQTLLQASEFYPEEASIEYRLAGFYFLTSQTVKGRFYLKNALRNNFDKHILIEELFPAISKRNSVVNFITEFKNTSM